MTVFPDSRLAPPAFLWSFPPADPSVTKRALGIAREFDLPMPLAELLVRRGMDPATFLDPKLKNLSDPFLLPDMRLAVDRILQAIDAGERITLFGDYDVDGVTSLAFLVRVLKAYGAEVSTFLPHRMDEGYGLSPDGVARCVETLRPKLLIAVDCGTSSAREIASLQASGVDVIVLDHHECPAELPACVAMVNPKRGADFHYLCSAGLAFKLGHALGKTRRLANLDLKDLLELVALGTVADIVPLVEENRSLVRAGSLGLARSRSVGIAALKEVAGVNGEVRGEDIGFRLGPRLNAAGRLDSAEEAFRLLTTSDPHEARALAIDLDIRNRTRQDVEKKTLAEAEEQYEQVVSKETQYSIVVGGEGWHPGVVGIVAARLSRKYHRPTLVIGFDEQGVGKGSGRSIEGVSLVRVLNGCSDLLLKYGGHEMAAGLSVGFGRLAELRMAFERVIVESYDPELFLPKLELDAELSFSEIDLDFLQQHERLQPFGAGNRQPLCVARGVQPADEPRVLKEKHLKMRLRQRGAVREAIFFSGAMQPLPRPPWDVAFRLEPNVYQGVTRLQLQIVAIRSSE